MQFVIITVLLLTVMLLIISSLIFGAWREYRRYKSKAAAQPCLQPHALDRHVTAIAYMRSGKIIEVRKPDQGFMLPGSWYTRRRMLISLGFLVMMLLALFIQSGLAAGSLQELTTGLGVAFLSSTNAGGPVQPAAHSSPQSASGRLLRLDSTARSQYYTDYQWRIWSYSSCSGMAMAMVMDAYERHLIAADVLQKELDLGVWSVQLGLLREEGIAITAAAFGFNADAGHTRGLQDIINTGNSGAPVIVSVRDAVDFPGGHLFVVRGGDSQYVYIADSSPHNFTRMTRSMFVAMWQGFSAVLTPRQ